jgi:NOL1/NOP2/sun family putative RNA methylase
VKKRWTANKEKMERVFERYGDIIPDFETFLESLKAPPPQHLRVNTLKIKAQDLLNTLEHKNVHLRRVLDSDETLYLAPEGSAPGKWLEYVLGYIHPQALTSCLASLFLSPQRGSYLLDLCASPGGKTSHLAQMMNNDGLIVANEVQRRRHMPLSNTLSRLGVLNTVTTAYPAQEFPLRGKFDFIMADVPCSGEGTFRCGRGRSRQGERKNRGRLSEVQRKIILRGFDLLNRGGQMLYATCTYNPDENESVVNFLLQNRDAEMLPVICPLPSLPGLLQGNKESYDRSMQRAVRFYPHFVNSVGFFMARIGRRG